MTIEEVIKKAYSDWLNSGMKIKKFTTVYQFQAPRVRKLRVEQLYHKTPLMTCYYCHQEIANKDIDTALSFKSKELVTMMHDVCKNCEATHIEKIKNVEGEKILRGCYQPTVDNTDPNNPPTEDSDTK